MQVRYSLIDSILRALGWDLDDPNSVQVELNVKDTVTNKRRDYTFCIKGKKVAILESKRWGTMNKAFELYQKDRADEIPGLNQLRSYCEKSNIKVGIISDGGCWVRFKFRPKFKLYKNGTTLVDYNCEKVGVNEKENRKYILKFFRGLSPRNIST
jgi:predicted type IV restriction endonuclease